MNIKLLSVASAIITIAMIIWNYFINAVGINNKTISDLSSQYENFFTPASYAFSIWGIIFVGLIVISVYLIRVSFKNEHRHQWMVAPASLLLISANVLNSIWSYFFLSEMTGWSVIAMFGILVSLIILVVKLKMENYDADFQTITYIWWPISFYLGWITVASIANVSAHLSKVGFDTIAFSDYDWTMIMIIVATIINLLMIKYRNMTGFALVGTWALVAIAVRHFAEQQQLANLALVSALVIIIAIVVHTYIHRKINFFSKLKKLNN
ncbi:MAG: hypothetical protein ACI870_000205 [Crocinitomicaceae bacterium]|jgi:hypothetical protein